MSIFDTLLQYYLYNREANKKPSETQLTPSPQQDWMFNFIKNYAEGNPYRDMATNFSSQYLNGLSGATPSTFKFTSPYLQGQTFAGGVQAPKIDMSKFMGPAGYTPSGGSGGGSGVGRTPTGGAQPGTITTGTPNGFSPNPFAGFQSGGNASNVDFGTISNWISNHPTTMAVVQGLIGSGWDQFNAMRAVYDYFTGPQNLPTNRNYGPNDVAPAGSYPSLDNMGNYEQPRQNWTPGADPMAGAAAAAAILNSQEGGRFNGGYAK